MPVNHFPCIAATHATARKLSSLPVPAGGTRPTYTGRCRSLSVEGAAILIPATIPESSTNVKRLNSCNSGLLLLT